MQVLVSGDVSMSMPYKNFRASPLEAPTLSSVCRRSVGIAAEPSPVAQQALVELSEHVRSLLISVLSYELQTPLSTIQVAIETLFDEEDISLQDKCNVLDLAQTELCQLCCAIENFLTYATEIWSMTLDFVTFQSSREADVYLNSMFTALPKFSEGYQPWTISARKRLTPFLQMLGEIERADMSSLSPQQYELLGEGRRQILAVVNHELRTPFSSLKVCLDTLQEEVELSTRDRQMLLGVALEDLQRLRHLVRDLELLGRLESGQVCFQESLVDVKATLHSMVNSFQTQNANKSISKICIESPSHIPLVWIDGDRLTEVFGRILENACRFTPEDGEIRIEIQTTLPLIQSDRHPENSESPALTICIADTGRGIHSEQLERIFDCFHQEEDYLQRTRGGVGIGLTICRYLVKGMGGQIWAESLGQRQGSRFYFKVPIQTES